MPGFPAITVSRTLAAHYVRDATDTQPERIPVHVQPVNQPAYATLREIHHVLRDQRPAYPGGPPAYPGDPSPPAYTRIDYMTITHIHHEDCHDDNHSIYSEPDVTVDLLLCLADVGRCVNFYGTEALERAVSGWKWMSRKFDRFVGRVGQCS